MATRERVAGQVRRLASGVCLVLGILLVVLGAVDFGVLGTTGGPMQAPVPPEAATADEARWTLGGGFAMIVLAFILYASRSRGDGRKR